MQIVFFLVAALIVAADQYVKHAVATHFLPDESRIVVPKVLWLTYVQNHRGAFGLFGAHPLVLAAIALGVVILFYVWYRQGGATLSTHVAFGMILGGAIGNIIDRVRFGYVVDFIDLRWWPVFNLADSAITIGVFLLLVRIMWHERRQPVPASHQATPATATPPVPESAPQ